jgi:hypothetical protein
MSDDAIDAHSPVGERPTEGQAREEQEALDRAHGQQILDVATTKERGEDPLLEALNRAHRAKAEADKQ